MYRCYDFFNNRINKNQDIVQIIDKSIPKLCLVDVKLSRKTDDPNLVFETMNSTGVKLSPSDEIRNWILMKFDEKEQEQKYEEIWLPMEKAYDYDFAKKFEQFLIRYVAFLCSKTVNKDKLYEEFKKYYKKNNEIGKNEILENIRKFSSYYRRIVFDEEEDSKLKKVFNRFKKFEAKVSYPFLLGLYDDYENEKIAKNEFIEIIEYVESYIIRLRIVDRGTRGLGDTFASLYDKIKGKHILSNLKCEFSLIQNSAKFPDDYEVKDHITTKPIKKQIQKYLLSNWEDKLSNKEKIDVDDLQIEHIMPQHIENRSKWKAMLGKDWKNIHTLYLNNIGNLTLTADNPKLSNKPFSEKRKLYARSSLKITKDVTKNLTWNKAKIIQRAQQMFKIAKKIWNYPKVPDNILNKYKKKNKTRFENEDQDLTYNEEQHKKFWTEFRDYALEQNTKLKPYFKNMDVVTLNYNFISLLSKEDDVENIPPIVVLFKVKKIKKQISCEFLDRGEKWKKRCKYSQNKIKSLNFEAEIDISPDEGGYLYTFSKENCDVYDESIREEIFDWFIDIAVNLWEIYEEALLKYPE